MMERIHNLEKKNYELLCLSPVHVGNGQKLNASEYLYDRSKETVYFINQAKWIALLGRHQLLDQFFKLVNGDRSGRNGENIWEWLIACGVRDEEIRFVALRSALAETNTIITGKKKTLNDIVCQIALPTGAPYIPGSTIKGLLRTGILYGLLKKHPDKRVFYWNEVKNSYNRDLYKWDNIIKEITKKIERDLLGKLYCNRFEMGDKNVSDAVKDALRGLMISDAVCIDENVRTIVLQKLDLSTKNMGITNRANKISLFRECLQPGTKLRFSITIDHAMLDVIGIDSVDEILAATHEFMQSGLQMQKSVFYSGYESEFKEALGADFLVGGGIGFLSKTLFYSLAPSKEEGKKVLVDYLNKKFKKHKHRSLDNWLAPRTLKLTRARSEQIMGLCKVQEEA